MLEIIRQPSTQQNSLVKFMQPTDKGCLIIFAPNCRPIPNQATFGEEASSPKLAPLTKVVQLFQADLPPLFFLALPPKQTISLHLPNQQNQVSPIFYGYIGSVCWRISVFIAEHEVTAG